MSVWKKVNVPISWNPERGAPLAWPEYVTTGAAGMDVRSAVEITLAPMARAAVPTGLIVEVPEGYELQVRARSGLSLKSGVTLVNGVGTIDADFRGEIHLLVVNLGTDPVSLKRGDRLAQLVLSEVPRVQWDPKETAQLTPTQRGEKGFGSSGVH